MLPTMVSRREALMFLGNAFWVSREGPGRAGAGALPDCIYTSSGQGCGRTG